METQKIKSEAELLAFFEKDRFATNNGATLVEIKPGRAKAELKITPEHLNAGGVAQGGAIFTLADLTMAAAANAHGRLAFSIQADIRFLQSAFPGDLLTAEAKEVLLHKTISHYHVSVVNQQGEEIAVCDGICYRK